MKLPATECDSWRPSAPVRNRNTGLATRHRFIYMRDLRVTLVGRDMKLRYMRSVLEIAGSLVTRWPNWRSCT